MNLPLHKSSNVVLFRDSSSDDNNSGSANDKYTELLQKDHHSVQSIPVLEHEFLLTSTNIQQLVDAQPGYTALLFTSKNSVKALSKAAAQWIKQLEDSSDDTEAPTRKDVWARFLQLPVFVVGKATASTCRSLLYSSDSTADIRGEDTGKATAMLPRIIEYCKTHFAQTGTAARLLFLCGNQRRDTLPQGLCQSNHMIELTELVSYTTAGRPSDQVLNNLVAALVKTELPSSSDSGVTQNTCAAGINKANHALMWLVCFSPSGVRVVAPVLEALTKQSKVLLQPGIRCSDVAQITHCYRIVAIGETTFSELVMQGVDSELVVLANEPNAQGVRNAINSKC
ncbi:uroporphyrinogen-III synthase [Coemansia sp. IMI 203386]|nr:uroporphyrinogen-III synthase [Coemansia sp. IMI 203386]